MRSTHTVTQELKWTTTEMCREFFIEMVLDRAGPKANDKDLKPAKDATVKRVNMGRDTSGSIQNMPEGRSFLVRVIGKLQVGKEVYSPWTRAITLSPKTRDKDLGNLDPMNMPRSSPGNRMDNKTSMDCYFHIFSYFGKLFDFLAGCVFRPSTVFFPQALNPNPLPRNELQQLPVCASRPDFALHGAYF